MDASVASKKETDMKATETQGSATILKFPTGGRAGLQPRHSDGYLASIAEPTTYAGTSYSEAWYHQEAIVSDREKFTRN